MWDQIRHGPTWQRDGALLLGKLVAGDMQETGAPDSARGGVYSGPALRSRWKSRKPSALSLTSGTHRGWTSPAGGAHRFRLSRRQARGCGARCARGRQVGGWGPPRRPPRKPAAPTTTSSSTTMWVPRSRWAHVTLSSPPPCAWWYSSATSRWAHRTTGVLPGTRVGSLFFFRGNSAFTPSKFNTLSVP